MRVVWLDSALTDTEDIADYIARNNAAAATRFLQRVFDVVERLADYPEMGRSGRVEGTRELVVLNGRYVVAYHIEGQEVEIWAVKDARQRWPESFS